MGTPSHNLNLNSHQLEILKLFSRDLDDKDLMEIKRLIVAYLSDKITKMSDDVWEKENWSEEKVNDLLRKSERKSGKS
ncbi:MAG: hypothetical protein KBF73_09075 [Flavobacteriales bacterium]|nr:hypothetical protein [Flavobacteriales bacterium]